MSCDSLRGASCRLGRSIFSHFVGAESKISSLTGISVFEATAFFVSHSLGLDHQ